LTRRARRSKTAVVDGNLWRAPALRARAATPAPPRKRTRIPHPASPHAQHAASLRDAPARRRGRREQEYSHGALVGRDALGNSYYENRRYINSARARRK
jgi:hypothetical protein